MAKKGKTLLNIKLFLEYYKGENINDSYSIMTDGIVIDKDCLEVIDNPNELLYITPLNKINKKENK